MLFAVEALSQSQNMFWFQSCFAKSLINEALAKNVPFVWIVKIVFKKCAVRKNKNIEILAFGSAV